MQLLQLGPAETTSYMIAGFMVIFGVLTVYLVSLIIRSRRMAQELALLEEMEQPESQPTFS